MHHTLSLLPQSSPITTAHHPKVPFSHSLCTFRMCAAECNFRCCDVHFNRKNFGFHFFEKKKKKKKSKQRHILHMMSTATYQPGKLPYLPLCLMESFHLYDVHMWMYALPYHTKCKALVCLVQFTDRNFSSKHDDATILAAIVRSRYFYFVLVKNWSQT